MDDRELLHLGTLLNLKAIRRTNINHIELLLADGTIVELKAVQGNYGEWVELVFGIKCPSDNPWLFIEKEE